MFAKNNIQWGVIFHKRWLIHQTIRFERNAVFRQSDKERRSCPVSTIRFGDMGSLLIPLVLAFNALVKYRHGLIGRSDLNLHKECFVMTACRTSGHSTIDILPGRGATKYIVDYFTGRGSLLCNCSMYRTRIGAGRAEKVPLR